MIRKVTAQEMYSMNPYRNDVSADEEGELLGDEIGEVHEWRPVGRVPSQHQDLAHGADSNQGL
jgi:hypothetical protein